MSTTPTTEQSFIWQLQPGDILQLSSAQLAADPTWVGPLPSPLFSQTDHLCEVGFLCWGMPQTLVSVVLVSTGDHFILDLPTTSWLPKVVS